MTLVPRAKAPGAQLLLQDRPCPVLLHCKQLRELFTPYNPWPILQILSLGNVHGRLTLESLVQHDTRFSFALLWILALSSLFL